MAPTLFSIYLTYGGSTCCSLPAVVGSSGCVLCSTVVRPIGVYLLLWSPLVVFCAVRWFHLLAFTCCWGSPLVVVCAVRWFHLLAFTGCGLLLRYFVSYGSATCWSLPVVVVSSGGVLCRTVVPPVGVYLLL